MQGTAETFFCVVCDRRLSGEELAFDTDPEHYLGVCLGCEPDRQEAEERPALIGREVA
jgi:hypothetical protein